MSLIPFAPFFTADFLAPFLALLLEGPAVCSASLQARFVAIRESRIGCWSARGRASRPERTRRTRRGMVVPRGAGHGGRGARAPQGLGAWLFAGTNVAQVYNLGFAGFCKLETCATREGLWQGRTHTQSVRSKVRYWMASLTWSGVMSSAAARSATVRLTFRMRS